MILINPIIFDNKDNMELWTPLVYRGVRPGEYLISNFGNIYDLVKGKYVHQYKMSSGYMSVSLRHTNEVNGSNFLVHRLVGDSFISSKGEDQTQVNHKDGSKLHNHDINLEWSTPKENTIHAFENGLADNNIGERSHLSKFTDAQVEEICQLLSQGLSYSEILAKMNMPITDNNRDMIGNIYRGIAWVRISSKYTFPEMDIRFRATSKENIERICESIEMGLDNKAVYERVFGKPLLNVKDDKQHYELIRLIRNKKQFLDISSKYNF